MSGMDFFPFSIMKKSTGRFECFLSPCVFLHPCINWIWYWKFCYPMRKSKQVEERLFQNWQCSGIHPELSCFINKPLTSSDTYDSHQKWANLLSPVCHHGDYSWKQLLQKSNYLVTSFINVFNSLALYSKKKNQLREWLHHSINQIPLFWDSPLKHFSQPEISPQYHTKQEVCSYYKEKQQIVQNPGQTCHGYWMHAVTWH